MNDERVVAGKIWEQSLKQIHQHRNTDEVDVEDFEISSS